MSERIRGCYDDALYKSTYALLSAHSDCCFFAPCTNIFTYLLTYLLTTNTTSVSFVRNHFGGADRAFDVLSVSLICPDHNV